MSQSEMMNIDTIRMLDFGLLISCPLPGDPNPDDCQMHAIRQCPVRNRAKWLKELSDKECERHYRAHTQCFAIKSAMMGVH